MADPTETQLRTAPPWLAAPRRPLVSTLGALALRAAWSARRPGEALSLPLPPAPERSFYVAADGWESPLLRLRAAGDQRGEPVMLAHGLGAGQRSFDLHADSLARHLQRAGYDVFLLAHRGDEGARPPAGRGGFDFDDIVTHDVPAALDRVLRLSGAARALWIGHALGGQLAYAHLARAGADQLAGLITLCAPVRFNPPRSHARLAAQAARLLPTGWRVPARRLHAALAPFGGEQLTHELAPDADPEALRSLMLHGAEDLPLGLARQAATWLLSGTLCDRDDRIDYIGALHAISAPLLAVVADADPLCPAEAAAPAVEALAHAGARLMPLRDGWGHLDVLIGRRATDELFPALRAWLEPLRGACWTEPTPAQRRR